MSSLFFKRRLSGIEYRIKVFRFDKRWQITLQDISSSSTWKGSFDQDCIETMTRKTGRFLPFEMFFTLLLSTLRNDAYDAQLDVMTFRDLQSLFMEEVNPEVAKQMEEENRRYLILTINQPIMTHYPLPLLHCQCPDPELMTMTKLEMQNIVSASGSGSASDKSPDIPNREGKRPTRKDSSKSLTRKITFGKGGLLERVIGEEIGKSLSDSVERRNSFTSGLDTVAALKREMKDQARKYKRELTRLRRENEQLRCHVEEMKFHAMQQAAELHRLEEWRKQAAAAGRCRSCSPVPPRRRRQPRSESTASVASRSRSLSRPPSPRPARSLYNFFTSGEATSARRRRSAERRGVSPPPPPRLVRSSPRLHAQLRSKSLDDASAWGAARDGRRRARRAEPAPAGRERRRWEEPPRRAAWEEPPEPRRWRDPGDPRVWEDPGAWSARDDSLERRLWDEPPSPVGWHERLLPYWEEPPARPRQRAAPPAQRPAERTRPRLWITSTVPERRRPRRQPSLEQLVAVSAPRSAQRPVQPGRTQSRARLRSRKAPAEPPPSPSGLEEGGDAAVVGMHNLETRLKNLQRMLTEKLK